MSFLDVSSLAALNATFDLRVHRWLHSPHMIEDLDASGAKSVEAGSINYLLKSLRNVNSLKLGNGSFWHLEFAKLLATLNPATLRLTGFQVSTMFHVAVEKAKDPLDADMQLLVDELKVNGLPKLARLMPRLENMQFSDGPMLTGEKETRNMEIGSYMNVRSYAMPSLTSFTMDSGSVLNENLLLADLPSTLTSLQLQYSFPTAACKLAKFFAAFPVLETLRIHGAGTLETTDLKDFPPSLTNLALLALAEYPEQFLESFALLSSKLASFDFSLAVQRPSGLPYRGPASVELDLSTTTPPSLRSMTLYAAFLSRNSNNAFTVSKLPTQLTSLSLVFGDEDNSVSSLSELQDLTHLTLHYWTRPSERNRFTRRDQRIAGGNPRHRVDPIDCIKMLPKSLKSLTLKGKIFDRGTLALETLKNLESLQLESSTLDRLMEIKQLLPQCHIKVTRPITVWSDLNVPTLAREMAHLFVPHVDMDRLPLAYELFLQRQRIYARLEFAPYSDKNGVFRLQPTLFTETKSMLWNPHINMVNSSCFLGYHFVFGTFTSLTKLVMRPRVTPATEKQALYLDNLPPSLTHLEFYDQPIISISQPLPTTLTHIQCNDTLQAKTDFSALPHLTFLDTPQWSWQVSTDASCRLSNMQRLTARLEGLADDQVETFLTRHIDHETLRNTSLRISFTCTGALISKSDLAESRSIEDFEQTCQVLIARLSTSLHPCTLSIDRDTLSLIVSQ